MKKDNMQDERSSFNADKYIGEIRYTCGINTATSGKSTSLDGTASKMLRNSVSTVYERPIFSLPIDIAYDSSREPSFDANSDPNIQKECKECTSAPQPNTNSTNGNTLFFSVNNEHNTPKPDLRTNDSSVWNKLTMTSYDSQIKHGVAASEENMSRDPVTLTYTLETTLRDIERLKCSNFISVNMIMLQALRLEALKNHPSARHNIKSETKIVNALNWCYATIGKIHYGDNSSEPTA